MVLGIVIQSNRSVKREQPPIQGPPLFPKYRTRPEVARNDGHGHNQKAY